MAEACLPKLVIPLSWYRSQKPLKPGNTKKYEFAHPGTLGWAPKVQRKYEKKKKPLDQSSCCLHFGPVSKEKQHFLPFLGNEEGWRGTKRAKITPNFGTLFFGPF